MRKKPLLNSAVLMPENGKKPKQLVIYLHGMGGTGETNAWFVKELQQVMPNAVFYVPDGLEPMDGNEEARQWFGIPKNFKDVWFTIPPEKLGKKPLKKLTRMYNWYNSAALKVIEFIRERMDFHKIGAQDTYIFGVSQGAMMAVQMIAESDLLADWSSEGTLIPLGGVMIIAGCLITAAEVEAHPSLARPEFIFVHGSEDTTVPFRAYLLTDKTLLKCGQKTVSKIIWGKDHTFFEKEAMDEILRLAKPWGDRYL